MIKYHETKLGFTPAEVAMFHAVWPCHGMQTDRAYWFEFDGDGNLTDTDVPEHSDGSAASALSQDAWSALQGEPVEWLKHFSIEAG
jgi:hypothetical protein